MVAAEQKKVLEQQIALFKSDIDILNSRIQSKEKEIQFIEARDSSTLKSYEKEIEIMVDQRSIFEGEIKALQKQIRKEKRKRVVTGILGIGSTALAFYIGSR